MRVVEYWRKRPVKKWLKGTSTADLEEVEDEPKDDGKTRKRPVMRHVVEMAVISGQETLTGWQEWPGKHIPIVPVIGEEVALEKRTVRRGLVRAAKPAQRLLNFMRSAEVELLAMQPKAPYLATAAQVKPFKADWESLNTRSLPVLLYEPDPKAPAPQRIAPPQVSTGLAEAVARATEDMKSITGIYDASLGAKSNETSGRAILAREKQGDTATYHFFDNFSRAVAYTGEIIVDLIPHYYDTARVVRIVRPDGSQDHVAVNDESKPYQPKKGEPTIIDLVKAARPNDAPPRLVINQVGVPKRPEIPAKDFAETMGLDPSAIIAFDHAPAADITIGLSSIGAILGIDLLAHTAILPDFGKPTP